MRRLNCAAYALVILSLTRTAAAEPPRNITFDAFRFEMKKGDPFERKLLTPAIEKFVGKKIRIRGWMNPGSEAVGLTEFYLLRHNLECCYGPEAFLYDNMLVKLNPGVTTNYTTLPVAVDGVFDVHEVKLPDGTWGSIYLLSAERVK
jgi:hypothetical protein